MRTITPLPALFLLALAPCAMLAQDSEHQWSKTYSATGKPNLTLEISDAHVQVRSCGDCHQVRIHVEVEGKRLSDYRLEESQSGDTVRFLLKERMRVGTFSTWHVTKTSVSVETPTELALDAHTSDGHVEISGLRGDLTLRSGDGNATLSDVKGNLHVESGDGHVQLTDAEGRLEARMSDGSLSVEGSFHAIALHTSDGKLDLTLREGSKLTEPSRIESSDGGVHIRVARDFSADLDVRTSDGHLNCSLPLTMDQYQNHDSSSHGLHGKLNGGGAPLSIHTSDGNVTIQPL